jgi:transposase InsO family protein
MEVIELKYRAVIDYLNKRKPTRDICSSLGISERTLRRWAKRYRDGGYSGLIPRARAPKLVHNKLPEEDEILIIDAKLRNPAAGARRLSYALLDESEREFNYRTIHRVLKRNGLHTKIKPKVEPCKRFERKRPDSLWQMDIYEFRIRGIGKVRVFGIIDDHSRWVSVLRIYKRKTAANAIDSLSFALATGRKPKALYVDNGRQFIAKAFRQFCEDNGIKLIVGRPYNPKARGKIEAFFKIMYRELISQVVFSDLDHAQLELNRFQGKYNKVRRHGGIGWVVPAERYFREVKVLQ